jgi:hypothetical protein
MTKYKFIAELDIFKLTISLSEAEDADFKATTLTSLQNFLRVLQEEQERNESMMYMKRLEPFLVSMKVFIEVAEVAEVFANVSDINSYLWVSNREYFRGNLLQENKLIVFLGSDEVYSHCK